MSSCRAAGDLSPTRAGRIAAAVVPDDNPAGAIYGTITGGALLAAETSQRATLVRDAGGVALALVLFWLTPTPTLWATGSRRPRPGRP